MKKTPKRRTIKDRGGPSKKSLEEIPEIDFSKYQRVPNPYAARIAEEGYTINVTTGRPKKGHETGPTIPRSIRFPASVWERLEERAKADGMTLHAALRAAVLAWIGGRPPRHQHAKG
ncbi:MAG: hypothetical protein HY904_19840 [Deltaproteobacteria bacterium]|nr:hypothetical protein [Deltaproteobacteria bacterium]